MPATDVTSRSLTWQGIEHNLELQGAVLLAQTHDDGWLPLQVLISPRGSISPRNPCYPPTRCRLLLCCQDPTHQLRSRCQELGCSRCLLSPLPRQVPDTLYLHGAARSERQV